MIHFVPLTYTLLLYMVFNILGFRVFHTYSGVIRYSSFIDLQRVGYAMALACGCVLILHYPILFWEGNKWFLPLHTRHILAIYIVATVLLWAFRVIVKMLYDTAFDSDGAAAALIYGVKNGGIGLAKNINNEKPRRFRLKGFISHDPTLKDIF